MEKVTWPVLKIITRLFGLALLAAISVCSSVIMFGKKRIGQSQDHVALMTWKTNCTESSATFNSPISHLFSPSSAFPIVFLLSCFHQGSVILCLVGFRTDVDLYVDWVCLCVCVCLCLWVSTYLSLRLSVCLSVCLSVFLALSLSLSLFVCLLLFLF